MPQNKPKRPRLREQVKAAGGWYRFLNTHLVRFAGPASVGPYEKTPEPDRTVRACPLCGHPMSQHTFDRSTAKTVMHCP